VRPVALMLEVSLVNPSAGLMLATAQYGHSFDASMPYPHAPCTNPPDGVYGFCWSCRRCRRTLFRTSWEMAS